MPPLLLILIGLALLAGAISHERNWWRIHLRRGEVRRDGKVRDAKDFLDKWTATVVVSCVGVGLIVVAVSSLA